RDPDADGLREVGISKSLRSEMQARTFSGRKSAQCILDPSGRLLPHQSLLRILCAVSLRVVRIQLERPASGSPFDLVQRQIVSRSKQPAARTLNRLASLNGNIEAEKHVLRDLLRFRGRETERQYVVINVIPRFAKEAFDPI